MPAYFGLLDDFAVRHHDAAVTSMRALNEHLLAAVLFGDSLLINDGYLLNHTVLQEAVLERDSSPLCQLVESGFVRILTRNERALGSLADRMAEENIQSARQLRSTDAYVKRLQPALSRWAEKLQLVEEGDASFSSWPTAHMSQIFKRLATTALEAAIDRTKEDRYRKELQEFQAVWASAGKSANRTDWEREADLRRDKHKNLSEEVHVALMHIANEAYQYAWGCALSEIDAKVTVESRAPMYLDLDVSLGELDPARPPEGVTVYGPDIAVAAKRAGRKWSVLAEIVRKGDEMTYAKARFMDELRAYYADPSRGNERVEQEAKRYSKALTARFGSGRRAFRSDVVSTVAITAASTAVGGPVGTAAGLGLSLINVTVAHTIGPKLLSKFSMPFSKPWITTKGRRGPVVTSAFQIDRHKAAGYLDGVEHFTR